MRAWVAGVAVKVGKPAKNATVKITLNHIYRTRGGHGRALDQAAVAKQIDAALDDGVTAPRTLHSALKKTSPAVNVNDLQRRSTARSSRWTRRTSSCASSRG